MDANPQPTQGPPSRTPGALRVAAFQPAQRPLAELLPTAIEAERLGFDSIWVAEDCFLAGGPTAAATLLARCERIGVGIGLLPAAVRNPAIVAMELGTLASLHPGRLQVAFGNGVPDWMRQIGAAPERRLRVLRDTVTGVRALLGGATVDLESETFALDAVHLDEPPARPPPILVGSTGPRGIAIAAEASDGLLLPEGAGPEAVAAAAGEMGGKPVVVYSWMRIDDDGERARAALVPTLRGWVEMGLFERQMAYAGIVSGVPLGPSDVARVAIAGDAEECAAALGALAAAGATAVAVMPTPGDASEQLERFGTEVLPRFNR
jgi:5,10-methylenetetrahydromethanopterin reductase